MKLHQILAIATVLSIIICLFGIVGVAYGLETPKTVIEASPSVIGALAASTAVTWAIGKVARAVL